MKSYETPTRPLRPVPAETEVQALQRQLRRAHARNTAEFDRGFQAAVLMVKHGADLARLQEASGVVAAEWVDTMPVPVVVPECHTTTGGEHSGDTLVQVCEFAFGSPTR